MRRWPAKVHVWRPSDLDAAHTALTVAPGGLVNAPEPFDELSPPYSTIVADPPWHYDESDRQGKSMPYSTMTVDEISDLPVFELSQPGAHLYLWTTNRYLWDARAIAQCWGFAVSAVLVWAKPPAGFKPVGRFSSTTEFVLHGTRPAQSVARRVERAGEAIRSAREAQGISRADLHRAVRGGRPTGIVFRWESDESLPSERDWSRLCEVLPALADVERPTVVPPERTVRGHFEREPSSWWCWPTSAHATKPPAFLDIVERVSPGPYVELFARAPRLGWDAWGKGYETERAS